MVQRPEWNRNIFWSADVTSQLGTLRWCLEVKNTDAASVILPLEVTESKDYSTAFQVTRLAGVDGPAGEGLRSAILTGQPGFVHEWQVVSKFQKSLVFVETICIEPTGPESWHISAACSDVTGLRESRLELLGSEQRYRALFESNPYPVFLSDPETLQFVGVNAAAIEHYGYSKEEFLSMSLRDIRPSEDLPLMVKALKTSSPMLVAKGMFRHRKKDGTIIKVEISSCQITQIMPDERDVRMSLAIDVTDHQNYGENLRKSQKNLARAQELANIGSWLYDVAKGKLECSEEYFRIVGSKPGDGAPTWEAWLNRIHPDDRSHFLALDCFCPSTMTSGEQDIRIIRPSGEERHVRSRIKLSGDEFGNLVQMEGTLQDITDRIVAERELRWKTAFLEAQVNSTIDGILAINRDGKRIMQNDRVGELWKVPVSIRERDDQREQLDHAISMCKHPELVLGEISNLYGNETDSYQSEIELIDGTILDQVTSPVIGRGGEFFGRIWTFRDVTERKKAESALRESESRLRALMETIPPIVWIANPTGAIEYFNERWVEYTGICRECGYEFGWIELVHPDDVELEFDAWKAASLAQQPLSIEVRIRRLDGVYRWFSLVGMPVFGADGELSKWFGTCTDIHDRRLSEEALERRVAERTTQLEVSNRKLICAKRSADEANHAKSEFLSRMSHELRTPLNSILGFGQLLQMQDISPHHLESVDFIIKGGRHLLTLINEILDISRVESGKTEITMGSVFVSAVIQDACSLLRLLAGERGVHLVVDQDLEDCQIQADDQRIKQVVINLLSNSIKYNHPGGEARVSWSDLGNDRVSISVTDNGWGISPEHVKRLYSPFDRLAAANSEIEGTGLGLALTKRLVTAMGGTISVTSALGVGSTFKVELAGSVVHRDEDSVTSEVLPRAVHSSASGSEFLILVIEDNPTNLRLIEVLLGSRSNLRLITALQGGVGLDLARQHKPDLVILDLHLPDLHGREVLKRLKESLETRAIPVLIITADASLQQEESLISAGADWFLAKPIDVEEFLTVVDQFIDAKPEASKDTPIGQ